MSTKAVPRSPSVSLKGRVPSGSPASATASTTPSQRQHSRGTQSSPIVLESSLSDELESTPKRLHSVTPPPTTASSSSDRIRPHLIIEASPSQLVVPETPRQDGSSDVLASRSCSVTSPQSPTTHSPAHLRLMSAGKGSSSKRIVSKTKSPSPLVVSKVKPSPSPPKRPKGDAAFGNASPSSSNRGPSSVSKRHRAGQDRAEKADCADQEQEEDGQDEEECSPGRRRSVFTLKQFQLWLDKEVEENFNGWNGLERSKKVTDGNKKLEAKHVSSQAGSKMALKTMTKAQYGRAKYTFVQQAVVTAAKLQSHEKFADIGSGIGTVVLQVAATIGCVSSIGVELCAGRHEIAMQLKESFNQWVVAKDRGELADRVEFFSGDFREHAIFSKCRDADVLFVNNAESIFGMRSVAEGSYTLDWHVARLACGMRVGSRVVTFEALTDLEHPHFAPCFERRDYLSEPGATSWTEVSQKQTKFFCYTKVGEQWTCSRCTCVNTLLRPSRSQWGESLHDTCEICEGDPAGHRKAYSIRSRLNKSSQ